MEVDLKLQLQTLFERYCEKTGRKESAAAQAIAGDWRFVDRLRDPSKTITLRKYDEIVAWFADNWPVDAEWPDATGRRNSDDHVASACHPFPIIGDAAE